MNLLEASKALQAGHHKYVVFNGKYSNQPVFISTKPIREPGENIRHIDMAQIAIAQLGIPVEGALPYFIEDFMGAGTCEPVGEGLAWVDGITGSMRTSNSNEFYQAIINGVELV
ncbi:hypothetical protein COS77_02860 [Candidatus Roizmanbacteria bacterium CG06_land_8_20_14_3_00_34_14]|uniref:Uncharacterized protein n=2 Tax=Candidatus Roizmaniibacteriota TaxID=1752723 RepID=A0A2M7AUE9_9BACT|nr:MAG: hypothetical protein COS77_02860 [Candidatus Roizmanbacteria bacterium CG06_land_8_20_14_3_00_34_14]